ncbi:M48 family metalloprotease [Streptomyces sp. TLI_171]|uniref:M48 family metalloprotease n=1 Tax=Streptomyces sp. TLI_171 TaxID=1938859 RepID=UPI000C1840CA|nr:M48 family metalloprotease [Streptomyces sp. TLI_171]RKE21707.1 peptidase M48-like protein [Streptomyces sp. TLI_171]
MTLAVWAPLLLPLLAAPLARRLAEQLAPRAAALTLAATAVALGGAALASLGLLAASGLLHLPYAAALAHLSPALLRPSAPGGAEWAPASATAGLALLVIAALGARTVRRQLVDLRRARAATGDGPSGLRTLLHRPDRSPALTVLSDDRADAYALPGRPHRVVATTGMLAALSAPERVALLAHERAHLAGRHHLLLAAAEYAAACHPALRSLGPALGYHLERWADECAAAEVGDRAVTARAIGRAALAAARAPAGPRPRLAPGAATGPVPRRVRALLSPAPPHRRALRAVAALALAGCLAATAGAAAEAGHDLHRSVETAQGELPAHHR